MNILYISKGEKLKIKENDLFVITEFKETKVSLKEILCIIMESIECSITSSVFIHCSDLDIPIIICNKKSQPQVYCHDLFDYHKLTFQLKNQIEWLKNISSFEIYQEIIKYKISNQLDLLKFRNNDSFNHEKINSYLIQVPEALDFEDLDSLESISARIYFKSLFGKDFNRSNDCFTNASLNYGYALVRSLIMNVVVSKGLHPAIGLWHHSQFNNFNLVDDLIEIYRPLVDFLVSSLDLKKEVFDKETKLKLQMILLQNVEFDDHVCSLKQSIIYFVDSLISCLNLNASSNFVIPKLRIDLYEF